MSSMEEREALAGITAVIGLFTFAIVFMFSDTIRGSVDLAVASAKNLYDRSASNIFGGPHFGENELTEGEKGIERMRDKRIGGLWNEGNTCFMNSVIQSLAALDSLQRFVGVDMTEVIEAMGDVGVEEREDDNDQEEQEAEESDEQEDKQSSIRQETERKEEGDGELENLSQDKEPVYERQRQDLESIDDRDNADDLIEFQKDAAQHSEEYNDKNNDSLIETEMSRISSNLPNVELNDGFQEDDRLNRPLTYALRDLISQINKPMKRSHTYTTGKVVGSLGMGNRWHGYDQEDAQEFFQQIMLKLEKEEKSRRSAVSSRASSAASVNDKTNSRLSMDSNTSDVASEASDSASTAVEEEDKSAIKQITPFDGGMAVRVGCLKCGETEGIRKGVVSSVDLSLGSLSKDDFHLEELLKEYCHMETIPGVECYRCSLLGYVEDCCKKCEELQNGSASPNPVLYKMFEKRVTELEEALNDPFIDDKKYAKLKPKTIKQLGDKTKQSMFTAPLADVLMFHINRSVFDMRTGYSRKNYAAVRFPGVLDMSSYTTDSSDKANLNPKEPMAAIKEQMLYRVKAVVIHYGSHSYGHYVCYRRAGPYWWSVSDNSVTLTTEQQVLRAPGVFMLFYERI